MAVFQVEDTRPRRQRRNPGVYVVANPEALGGLNPSRGRPGRLPPGVGFDAQGRFISLRQRRSNPGEGGGMFANPRGRGVLSQRVGRYDPVQLLTTGLVAAGGAFVTSKAVDQFVPGTATTNGDGFTQLLKQPVAHGLLTVGAGFVLGMLAEALELPVNIAEGLALGPAVLGGTEILNATILKPPTPLPVAAVGGMGNRLTSSPMASVFTAVTPPRMGKLT